MTILFFSRLFYPHGGGVERHVLEVGKRLVEKGHKVTVVAEQYQTKAQSAKATASISGIDIVRHDFGGEDWFKKFRIWQWLWQHRDLIQKADIVHAHDVFFWYLPFRFLYPTKPVYTTFHGYETKFPPAKKAIFVRKLSEKLSWGNICAGEYIKKWYGTKPTYVTYGGVDDLRFKNNDLRFKNDKLRIVLIGRLEKDIGIPLYLEALVVLKKKKIDFSFKAYGEGSLKNQVEKYGKVHTFTKNIAEVVDSSDIIFASSYLTILQALAQKKLVVAAYDNELKKDYIQMAPFAEYIVHGSLASDLAGEVMYVAANKNERNKKIDAGYSWVKNQTWDKVVNIYLKLWHI